MELQKQIWGFTRVSTGRQSYEQQKLEILHYANAKGQTVDRFLDSVVSSKRSEEERGIDLLREAAKQGKVGIVVFAELSRLGRSVGELCRLVKEFVEGYEVEFHFIKEGFVLRHGKPDIAGKVMLTMFSLLAEIERDLISERTKSALAARKAQGVKLGRPFGTSKLTPHEEQIRAWLEMGVTQKAMCRKLECGPNTLRRFINRNKKEWKKRAND